MAVISMSLNSELPTTQLPNSFIDNYMSVSNPTFVIVYIFFYRHNLGVNKHLTLSDAATDLGILESDVINALKHWEKEGLLKFSRNEEDYSLTFLAIPERKSQKQASKPVAIELVKPHKPAILESRPQYTVHELDIYKREHKEIESLFSLAEHYLGKLLNYNDLRAIFGLYDWLGLPLNVIEVLIKYCADNGHRSMRYIERVAVDWSENEISTAQEAEAYIKRFGTDYGEILKALGSTRRTPTKTETGYMKKWIEEYEMPMPIILEACDKTIMQTGQGKFSYVDTILTDWNQKGIRTLEDIKANDAEHQKSKEAKRKKPAAPAKQSKYVNFKQRDWDYDKIEALERQYLNGTGDSNEL